MISVLRLTQPRFDGAVAAMSIEQQLRERLRKVESLYFGAATFGERQAAGAAAERLKAKLEEFNRREPSEEMKFTLPDQWSARLFVALCRRHGLRPYRYPRQRNTTILVRAPRRFFDAVILRQFSEIHADLWRHFEETTDRVIREAVYADASDAETVAEPFSAR